LMKLNEFFNQTSKPSRRPTKVISIRGNEDVEAALQVTVQELKTEVQRLKVVEQDGVVVQNKLSAADRQLNTLDKREQAVQAQKVMLNDAIQQGDVLRDENTVLEVEIANVKGQFAGQASTLRIAQENNLDLNNTLGTQTTQVTVLQQEAKSLIADLSTSKNESVINRDRVQNLQQQKIDNDELFLELQENYKEEQRRNSETTQQAVYWQRVANSLQEKQDQLENTHKLLTTWASTLEADNTEKKGVAKVNKTELTKLRGAIGTMTMNIDGLIHENKTLSSFNTELKKELARPKYMSMGAIAIKEGFKMPLATINFRTKSLGTSAPTLLKFKEKEEGYAN